MGNRYFFTGFPGFIATNLVRHLIDRDQNSEFDLLVHPSQLKRAELEIEQLIAAGYSSMEKYRIHTGDITLAHLGLEEELRFEIQERVDYLFHLAAIYDLAVPKEIAYQINIVGTRNVNEWALTLPNIKRYVYFSTAYVSGRRTGPIYETELAHTRGFKNHYESTKYEAEVLVQEVMNRIPTTIIRPGIVMGNSKTGETVKFDGPYFVMRFLDKFKRLPIPYVGKGDALINLVPIDYVVNATCYLAHEAVGVGKVYHLADPKPYTSRDAFRLICESLLGKKPAFTLPAAMIYSFLSIPLIRRWASVEKQTIEYFKLEAKYDCTQAVNDLTGSGISCPDFADYIQVETDFYKKHRDDLDKRILVK